MAEKATGVRFIKTLRYVWDSDSKITLYVAKVEVYIGHSI